MGDIDLVRVAIRPSMVDLVDNAASSGCLKLDKVTRAYLIDMLTESYSQGYVNGYTFAKVGEKK